MNLSQMTTDQVADHFAAKTRKDLVKFLKDNSVEVEKGEGVASLLRKAIGAASLSEEPKGKAKKGVLDMSSLISQARESHAEKTAKKSERKPSGPSKNHVAWAQILDLLLRNPDGISSEILYQQTIGYREGKSKVTLGSQLTNIRTALAVFGLGTLKTDGGLMRLEFKDGVRDAFMAASLPAFEIISQKETKKDD